jgi:hypothetical protein
MIKTYCDILQFIKKYEKVTQKHQKYEFLFSEIWAWSIIEKLGKGESNPSKIRGTL